MISQLIIKKDPNFKKLLNAAMQIIANEYPTLNIESIEQKASIINLFFDEGILNKIIIFSENKSLLTVHLQPDNTIFEEDQDGEKNICKEE